jgi:alpha-methylacyl-CoA racemase
VNSLTPLLPYNTSKPAAGPLTGLRVLSLALNLPGPAALMRCRELGAHCTKFEPPAGDPMALYSPLAYQRLHGGIEVLTGDLKTGEGQLNLRAQLAQTDVLLTSFRPSALAKLNLGRPDWQREFPALSQVAIVGAPGERAEIPGHDLTYLAEQGLVQHLDLPATLYADMAGALLASEAVLLAALQRHASAPGSYQEVALLSAAAWLALPRSWGLTTPGATIGGGHAGYQVLACRDGRVALAALEPHFAARLCAAAGLPEAAAQAMHEPQTLAALTEFFGKLSRAEIDQLAEQHALPLHTLSFS